MILLFLINKDEIKDINHLYETIYENHNSISKSYIFIETYETSEESINIYEKYKSLNAQDCNNRIKYNKVHILDFYQIYKFSENDELYYTYDYDIQLLYEKIIKLYNIKKYGYVINIIEKYLAENNEITKDNELKSILIILCAKSKEECNYPQYDIIETYAKSYKICNNNFIGIYELLVKFRLNNNYISAYQYAKDYINRFTPTLINDINGEKYNDFIENIILKSTYLNKENINIYLFYLEFEIIIITLNLNIYDIAYQLCNRILLRPSFENIVQYIPNDLIKQIQYFQSVCIDHIKDKYIFYDIHKMKSISTNILYTINDKSKSIIFTITTCKRYDLFEKTINSFINCTPEDDLKLIKEWLCVDDNSSIEDREKMQINYPFFQFIWKNMDNKGHISSMNIIRNYVLKSGYNYTLHMEDDWQSVIYFNSISRAIEIMGNDDSIKQVVYNRNYVQNICVRDIDLNGGIRKYIQNPIINKHRFNKYILHQFIHQQSPEFTKYIESINNGPTIVNWPYYSLNPSVLSVDVYKACDIFEKITWHFEFDYAVKFLYNGFKTAFFDGIYKLHIGKPLGSNDEKNAYDLNNEIKFVKE